MNSWEEWLKLNAPALANSGGNQDQVAMDNYNANADVGVYENVDPGAPQLPPEDGYSSGLTMPDLNKYTDSVLAENKPKAEEQAKPSKWEQFGKNFQEIFPSLLTAYAMYRDHREGGDGTGPATAVRAYLAAKQRAIENDLRERQWQSQEKQREWENGRLTTNDKWNQYYQGETLNQNKHQFEANYDQQERQNERQNNQFNAKLESDNNQFNTKLIFDNDQFNKTLGFQTRQEANRNALGYATLQNNIDVQKLKQPDNNFFLGGGGNLGLGFGPGSKESKNYVDNILNQYKADLTRRGGKQDKHGNWSFPGGKMVPPIDTWVQDNLGNDAYRNFMAVTSGNQAYLDPRRSITSIKVQGLVRTEWDVLADYLITDFGSFAQARQYAVDKKLDPKLIQALDNREEYLKTHK